MLQNSRSLALAACVLLTAACEGVQPLAPAGELPRAEPTLLAALRCTATIATGEVGCESAPPGTGGASGLIVGGQGTYVFLEAASTAFDEGTGVFSMDVTVQNLIPQALGTVDGSTPDGAGVRVFFNGGPTGTGGNVTLQNQDGAAFFLSADQPYFQWSGPLATNQTTDGKTWQFGVEPGATGFTFVVYVAAQVQFPDGWIDLGVAADTLVEGALAPLAPVVRTVVGNAVPDAVIEWESSDSAVATVDAAGEITAVAPGLATITATSGARTGSATVAVCPDLAVGEAYTAVMPAAASLCLAGGESGTAEYTYMPVNMSTASSLSLTVTGAGITGVTGPPSPALLPLGGPRLAMAPSGLDARDAWHMSHLEQDRALSMRLAGRSDALVKRGRSGGASYTITPGVPAVGDLWNLNVATGCSGTLDTRVGQVRAVGSHIIVVADTANPAGGFTTAQYDSIVAEFDSMAYNVNVDNFGAPTDLDGNGRVVAFYTRAVNELSPPASSVVTLGYVNSRDLYSTTTCNLSNEGEIFYMLVPDPTGAVNSNVRTVSYVRGNTVGTLAHEFQHLINSARRIYVNGAPVAEEVWLNEGLSHIAEELMFYRASFGLAPRQNINLSMLTTGTFASRRVAAFNTYANQNYGRLRGWLQRPDTSGAFKNGNLATRGAIWAYLRYSADRLNGTDATLWYNLVNSTTSGTSNLAAALGADPHVWLRDFTSAMYADDGVTGIGAEQQITSWNFRSVYGGLGGVPHGVRPLSNGVGLTLSYSQGGGTAWMRFGVPTGAFAGLTALSAGVPPVSPYALIVLRTK
jgi:hypothetical protein